MDDEHFLERLERLDDGHVTDALALYYDAELVRAVLAYAEVRSESDRVAISLGDVREGPFLVVARSGAFITALGHGMETDDLPVVPRSAWEAIRRQHESVESAWRAALEVTRGRTRDMQGRFVAAGPRVSRELLGGLIATANVQEKLHVAMVVELHKMLGRALQSMGERDRWRRLNRASFDTIALQLWALGNMMVVLATSDHKKRSLDHPSLQAWRSFRPTQGLAFLGLGGPLARGTWAVGKLGGLLFPMYKADFRDEIVEAEILETAVGLGAIGMRFSKHRGEIRKLLTISETRSASPLDALRRIAGATVLEQLDKDAARSMLIELGTAAWRQRALTLPPGHPLRVGPTDPVPDELSLPTAAQLELEIASADPRSCERFVKVATAINSLDATELYYPQAVIDALPPPPVGPGILVTKAMMIYRELLRPPPVEAAPRPGRNEPCPCGSGKKYKRCCGA